MNRQPRWQQIAPENLESIYNPRAASANVQAGIDRRISDSKSASQLLAGKCHSNIDLRYGEGAKQTLDLYRPLTTPTQPAPLAIFIHGGYWRAGDKNESTLVVPALLNAGAVVANVNYDLCPNISLDTMVEQIIGAVRYCYAHAPGWHASQKRLLLIGHSAGAHLAARVMNATPNSDDHDTDDLPANLVSAVVAISGIYEPEIITHISVNEEAQIDKATARRNDCLINPPLGNARYLVIAGSDEPAGWIDQSLLYAECVKAAGNECEFLVLSNTDHFTVSCETFIDASSAFSKIMSLV